MEWVPAVDIVEKTERLRSKQNYRALSPRTSRSRWRTTSSRSRDTARAKRKFRRKTTIAWSVQLELSRALRHSGFD